MQEGTILIARERIATMIPHAGKMCLLDGVLRWDAVSVHCLSRRYHDKDNPMRRADGTLGTTCGIEIAAQAMALHDRLITTNTCKPRRGYLASVRDVVLATDQLDQIPGDLMVDAERLMGDSNGATYRFRLSRQGVELLTGRATIIMRIDE